MEYRKSLSTVAVSLLLAVAASSVAWTQAGANGCSAHGTSIAFVGRTEGVENYINGTPVTATIGTPPNIQDGDFMLAIDHQYNPTFPLAFPTGWTYVVSINDFSHAPDDGDVFFKIWHTGDPTSFTFGSAQAPVNSTDFIMRVYRGAEAVDAFTGGYANANLPVTIGALPPTSSNNETYVAFFTCRGAAGMTAPSDLLAVIPNTAVASIDGDKPLPNAGTVPNSETISAVAVGNCINFGITLAK